MSDPDGRERVTFLNLKCYQKAESIELRLKNWYAVRPKEYEYQSQWYVELKDEMRQKVIKMAFDQETAVGEFHSHPFQSHAAFSASDLSGLREYVRHVRWRLRGLPYVAGVIAREDFDGLIWFGDAAEPRQLDVLVVGTQRLYPSESTLSGRGEEYE